MTMQPDNDIAALFDPNFEEPEPAVVVPGALPQSWVAAMAANRAAAGPVAPAPTPELAWSKVPPNSFVPSPAPVASPPADAPDEGRGSRRDRRRKRGKHDDPAAEFNRQSSAAK